MKEANHITEAEWQIMRIVWEKAPVTSGGIIEALQKSIGWSPTTIKTLLSRLVKKNVIGFEEKGRTFYYRPLVTEEACIKEEMRILISRVYGGALHKETSHFMFYGSNDQDYIDTLSHSLESNYERIVADLGVELTEKVTLYIHSSLQRLHSALGVLNGPAWLRTGWTWGILHIVTPEYFTDLSAEKVAVHSLAEIIIQKINPQAPYWLHQGIAAYESRWLNKDWIKSIISDKVKKDKLSPLKTIMSDYRTFGDDQGYVFAYTVAEFIVENYGFSKLGILLRAPNSFLETFHCPEEQFWGSWVDYIEKNYL
ncbi:MAG: BlaI/MecI/CopY family transcriptional regulator [Clostridia bacterium]|nr:BlaI/MecI/CopY family transcriptional regulator [Clostridia bacterium]